MKNIFNKFAFFIALSFVFISCGNLTTSENDDSIPQGKGKITISTDLQNGRSVLPTAITKDTRGLTWILSGVKAEESKQIGYWEDDTDKTAYQKMVADTSLLVDTGTWDFTLTASNTDGKNVLSATISTTINAGKNSLNFEMKEATENAASGELIFSLKFPSGVVDQCLVGLYRFEDGKLIGREDPLSSINDPTAEFDYVNYLMNDAAVPEFVPGYYILKFELQQNQGNDTNPSYEIINTYTCLVRVAPGLLTQGEYTLNNLAPLYTVNYQINANNGESLGSDVVTTSYNEYTSFELPTPTKEGYDFVGWYTDDELINPVVLDGNGKYRITQDTTLYPKWLKSYTFVLGDQDDTPAQVDTILANYVSETKTINVANPDNSDTVWSYYIKTLEEPNNPFFSEGKNYKISLEMKSNSNSDTVVGIQAGNTDMFFTVGTNWTKCSFETGFIKKALPVGKNGITIGTGLSSSVSYRNLVIEEISEDDGLPTLVFDITKTGIEQYLGTQNKADQIIEVEKTTDIDNKLGYKITINTPLTNEDLVQNVKLHLRSYATVTTGANNVSFKVSNTGGSLFATSFMADTASNNSMAWNNGRTEVVSDNSCNIDFPNYEANDELTVDVITGSSVAYQNYPVEFTISEFKVEEPEATAVPFSGKIFAIQVGETWTQGKSVEVTILVGDNIEFDVGMFNDWDSNNNMPSSFDDVTRFLYTGDEQISDNLSYSSDPNAPTYTIINNSSSDVKVKITLDDEYKVQIEEVVNQPIDLTTDTLLTYLESDLYRLPTGEYRVTDSLTLSYPIYIDSASTVKIYADYDVEITPNFTTGPMINLPMSTNSILTLGGGNGTLTLKGTDISSGSVISSNASLIIEDGFKLIDCDVCAINVTSGTFTMNGGEITNISREGHIINIGGGTAIFNGGSIYNNECVDWSGTSYCIYVEAGTLNIPSNSTASIYKNYSSISAGVGDEKGAFIYNNNGTVTILGSDLAKGTCYDKAINSGSSSNEPLTGTEVDSFEFLQAAINDGTAEVFIITKDITITECLDITRAVTIAANTDVTVTDDSKDSDTRDYAFWVKDGGNLTLGGGSGVLTFKHATGKNYTTIGTAASNNVTIEININNNVKFTENEYYCISFGAGTGAVLNINGGEFVNNSYTPIQINNLNAVCYITGGTIANNSSSANNCAGIYVKYGNLIITGGNITDNTYTSNDSYSGSSIRVPSTSNGAVTINDTAITESITYTTNIINGIPQ